MGQLRLAVFLLILSMSCSMIMRVHSTLCKENERSALLNLTHTFFYGPYSDDHILDSWVGNDCCSSWEGVECDNVTGNIVKLDMGRNFFSGGVSPALLELKYLSYLDLSEMDISQSVDSLHIILSLPSLSVLILSLCSLENSHLAFRNSNVSSTTLQHLDLSANEFSGTFPHFIQNLTSLTYLDVSWNQFNSSVPSWLGNHSNLTHLDLKGNVLYGFELHTIGLFSGEVILELKYLSYLDLSSMDMSQSLDILHKILKLPSLSILILKGCYLGNSHLVKTNSTVYSGILQQLDLSDNLFSGPLPHFIKNLRSLISLDLSSNGFNSSASSWGGSNLVSLTHLDLHMNAFSGSFPSTIHNLSSLEFLDLSMNQITHSVPSWLANKTKLSELRLNNNHFDRVDGGLMNFIGHFPSLYHLDLSDNQLKDDLSESNVSVSLSCLTLLNLSMNYFETLPLSLGRLSSLWSLDLSQNNVRIVNEASLANLSTLIYLDLSSNTLFLNVSSQWLPPFQLYTLRLLPCKMNSPFPEWILSQNRISQLDLSDTGIYGPLPSNIGKAMTSLLSLQLANNNINGSIPQSLCELASLKILNLQKNMLSGMIPDCWVHSLIIGLELSSNRLSGNIPNSLTMSRFGNLKLLSLSNNYLEGELPLSLKNCTGLMILDVGMNNFHGAIPSWNGADFPSLQILILRENRFKGIIPPQLCSIHTLQIIDLASNSLGGTIPQCFGHLECMGSTERPCLANPPFTPNKEDDAHPSMKPDEWIAAEAEISEERDLLMTPDKWSAVEVIKGEEREYTTVLHLVNMDLSSNNLVGVIPAEFASLSLLIGLNLSHNHLNGTIPKEIGRMEALESLDLSHNHISGSIPESIASLTFLSTMDLSFNHLQGRIPTAGGQLHTLNDSSYIGNPELCGDPLPRKCFSIP